MTKCRVIISTTGALSEPSSSPARSNLLFLPAACHTGGTLTCTRASTQFSRCLTLPFLLMQAELLATQRGFFGFVDSARFDPWQELTTFVIEGLTADETELYLWMACKVNWGNARSIAESSRCASGSSCVLDEELGRLA